MAANAPATEGAYGLLQSRVMGLFSLTFLLGYLIGVHSAIEEDFSNQGLSEIPASNISEGVVYLILSDNLLTQIGDNAFSTYNKLAHLELNNNELSGISATAFEGCILETLSLGGNYLTTFPLLEAVASTLKSIDLTGNQISNVISASFEPLVMLSQVTLDKNALTDFGFRHGFQPALKEVYIQVTNLYDLDNAFTEMPYIETLKISKGSFLTDTVTDADFTNTSPKSLTMASMQMKTFPHFPNTARGLLYISMARNKFSLPITAEMLEQFSQLQALVLPNCRITIFPDIRPLGDTLTYLNLDNNALFHIPAQLLSNSTQLESIHLSGNQLREVPDFGSVSSLMTDLKLDNNQFEQVNCTFLEALPNIKKLSMVGNCLNATCFESMPDTLRQLKMQQNYIVQVNLSYLCELKDLSLVQLSENPIHCTHQVCSHLCTISFFIVSIYDPQHYTDLPQVSSHHEISYSHAARCPICFNKFLLRIQRAKF